MLFSHDCTPHSNSYGICLAQRAMATVLLISIRELVIVSELDYCNSLLVGVCGTPLRWLQSRSSLPLFDWFSQLCCENNATPATMLLLHQLQSLEVSGESSFLYAFWLTAVFLVVIQHEVGIPRELNLSLSLASFQPIFFNFPNSSRWEVA